MSTKTFTLTSAMFSAVISAMTEGLTVEKQANSAVALGVCSDPKVFVTAFEAMSVGKAESLSFAGARQAASKVKPSKAGAVLKAAKLVAEHNANHPSSPAILSVNVEGIYSVVYGPTPKRKRASKGEAPSPGSNVSAAKVAEECAEQDGYTFRAESNGSKTRTFYLNDTKVEGSLVQALFTLCTDEGSDTRIALRKGNKKPKGE